MWNKLKISYFEFLFFKQVYNELTQNLFLYVTPLCNLALGRNQKHIIYNVVAIRERPDTYHMNTISQQPSSHNIISTHQAVSKLDKLCEHGFHLTHFFDVSQFKAQNDTKELTFIIL